MIGSYLAAFGLLLVVYALVLVWDDRLSIIDCGILGICLFTFGLLGQAMHAIWAAL